MPERRQRRAAAAEVVDGNADADRVERLQDRPGGRQVVEQQTLGQFDLQRVRRDAGLGDAGQPCFDQTAVPELRRRDVHGNPQALEPLAAPGGGPDADGLQHPRVDRRHQPDLFGDLEKGLGRQQPVRRVSPAEQRLQPRHPRAPKIDHRLIDEHELATVERLSEVVLQAEARLRLLV